MNVKFVQRIFFSLLFLSILCGAASIPFLFESPSILYKLGADKTMLRTGKVLGLLAATLFFMQIVFRARIDFLQKIFSIKIFNTIHLVNGKIIAVCILLHPPLVFKPNDLETLSSQLRYWPEAIGGLVHISILSLVVTAVWRNKLNIQYKAWLKFHRYGSLVAACLLISHILFVSESFAAGLPRILAASFFALFVLLWVQLRVRNSLR